MSMTLAQLRAFLRTLELGTFTRAAEELDVSQASVSELVSRLEEHLETRLFVRGGRRMVPTAAAEELRTYALRALQAAEDANHAMQALRSLEAGVARFGVLRNANYYGLTRLVETFHARHPQVRIHMVGVNSHDVAQAVESGHLEAGIVVLPVGSEDLEYEPLFRDEVLFATAHEGPANGSATTKDLDTAGLVLYDAQSGWADPTRRQLLDRAQQAGHALEPLIEVEQVESALTLVANGTGATVVSDSLRRAGRIPDGVEVYPFEPPLLETLALVRRKDTVVSRATTEMMSLVREFIHGPRHHR
ncbi:LysR family transcriptional regulator [Nesterenkonia halotolerans]|uniref:DNA-binding transcriptional LysR family regulator n=1 Tax=Nesterenkonia halotolerans TaxID=225325 RepID=A0ABR9J822_9MICC|nr:LysR family transcriptional regulator [Nesterenkonia halotolerans]MBE1515146.1 DNA-binding transcriptional LysR family regulator [Nesterenkonia halotolerans]